MMRSHRRQALTLLVVVVVAAAIAQFAGVGAIRTNGGAAAGTALASLPGAAVPDQGSSTLADERVAAREGEVVRMHATAKLALATIPRGDVAQVVCGIRYEREGNASWTLGAAYDVEVLRQRGARATVDIERSFIAPATDTYRMRTSCHVASPADGVQVDATGRMVVALGAADGAAVPARG